jgi:hypothetical protein
METSKAGVQAEVLLSTPAKFASSAGLIEPGDTDPFAKTLFGYTIPYCIDHADDLMARCPGQNWGVNIPFHGVQVCVTHTANPNGQSNLARTRLRKGQAH